MSMVEAMWEVTVRILRALVLAMLVVLVGCLICGVSKYIVLLLPLGAGEALQLVSSLLLLLAVAFAAGLFAVAARYPTENDHDISLAISGKFMVIRALQSAAVANFFLWVFYPVLNPLTGLFSPFSVVLVVFWLSWTAALAGAFGAYARVTSVLAGIAVATGMVFIYTSGPQRFFLFAGAAEVILLVGVPAAFANFRYNRYKSELAG